MPRKSVKENKNVYQLAREEMNLTRAEVYKLTGLSDDTIKRIEEGSQFPKADQVLLLSDAYKKPGLCNYFCSNQCDIGKKCVPEIKMKALSQIVLEIVVSLNELDKEKDDLMKITSDGKIDNIEIEKFINIQDELEKISLTVNTLKQWSEEMLISGAIDRNTYEAIRERLKKK